MRQVGRCETVTEGLDKQPVRRRKRRRRRDRQTDRQRQRQTDRQTDADTERQRARERDSVLRDKQTRSHTDLRDRDRGGERERV